MVRKSKLVCQYVHGKPKRITVVCRMLCSYCYSDPPPFCRQAECLPITLEQWSLIKLVLVQAELLCKYWKGRVEGGCRGDGVNGGRKGARESLLINQDQIWQWGRGGVMEELCINKKVFCVALHPVKAQLAQESCCARPIRLVAAASSSVLSIVCYDFIIYIHCMWFHEYS